MSTPTFTKTVFFSVFLLVLSPSLFAQTCPPPGFPEPGNTCPEAPILCPNLDGYCATINNNNVPQLFPCCNGGWILNNDEWFAFFAGTTTISIEVVPQNCTDGINEGLQGGIYDGCPINGCNAMAVQCECTEDPFVLSSSSYVIGQVYWFVLDGCSGNVCDYTIHVLEGSTIQTAPNDLGAITGLDTVCQNAATSYSIDPVAGATSYSWALTPPDAGILTGMDTLVTVSWSDTFSGIANLCVTASNACLSNDTSSCLNIEVRPLPTRSESISFCPGGYATINGQVYTQSGIVLDTLASSEPGGCDTIVTYTLSLQALQTRAESISFCPGASVNIGGQLYTQSGTVTDTIPSTTGSACDTVVTYTLTLLPLEIRAETISFCPGRSVIIGGQVYDQSGTVVDTVAGLTGCDTIVTYTLTLLPQPTRAETIAFCPGETITLGGANYTQVGTVVLTLPAVTAGACDTIVTYTLKYATPAPSTVSIACPNAISVQVQSGSTGAVASYNPPTANSDCTCPGIALAMTSGLASGSNFPLGVSSVCYAARDSCGQLASCCFNVAVVEDDDACDTKVNGCIKYELLTITQDMAKNRTYRIRMTNNCTNKLLNTAFQLPNGVVAIAPMNLSTYMAPSGNTYTVRNPNYSPQYSIRYSSISDSINLGESDIFKYTLPAQADVTFIHVVTRLAPNIYLEAHLNTFYCPIGVTPNGGGDRPGDERNVEKPGTTLLLFPNPASQIVRAETGGQTGVLSLLDAMGRVILHKVVEDATTEFSVEGLPIGLYRVVFAGESSMLSGTLMVHH